MTNRDSNQKPSSASAAPMRRVLWFALAAMLIAPVVGVLLSFVVEAAAGWGVGIGLALPAAFFGATALVAWLTAPKSPTTMAAIVLGSWLVKIVVILAVLFWLRDQEFYDRSWFLGAFGIGVVAMLMAELLIVKRAQVPYVEPSNS